MRVIGLTGGIGTGKSTVAGMFAKLGAEIVDADSIAHQALKKGSPVYRKIIREFGDRILTNGKIDRKRLADVVFKSPSKRKKLESIIHPFVRVRVKRKIRDLKGRGRRKVVVVEVPLLFEAGFHKFMDETVVVTATQDEQIKRTQKSRKLTKAEIRRRRSAQWPLTKKIRYADWTIDNNGTKSQTRKQVRKLWQKLTQKTKK